MDSQFLLLCFWSIFLNIGLLLSALLLMGLLGRLDSVLLCDMSLFSEPVDKFQLILSVSVCCLVCICVWVFSLGFFETLESVIWFPSLFLGNFQPFSLIIFLLPLSLSTSTGATLPWILDHLILFTALDWSVHFRALPAPPHPILFLFFVH